MAEFNLLRGEKIVYKTKPLPNLKWYFFLKMSLMIFFVVLFVGSVFLRMFYSIPNYTYLPLSIRLLPFVIFLAVVGFGLSISYFESWNRYKYRYYWVTNKRVIFKRGLLGYSISSIPLERVSDVIVSRSFFERILGFGSVHIQSLAGQLSRRGFGAEASFNAVPCPEKTQQLFLELISKKR
jgi:uncharacterized membrane protein YdbT with pleckstrin-like domain